MEQLDFYLDGKSARSAGIRLQGPISFSAHVPRVQTVTIPGRSGDLHMYDGSYENITAEAACFALRPGVSEELAAANAFLFQKTGYRRLETPDDPAAFRLARVVQDAETRPRMNILAPFTLCFDCKPQRFLKSGERAIHLGGGAASFTLINPTAFDARPLIRVKGAVPESAPAALNVSGAVVQILRLSAGDILTLDCDTQNAYSGTLNKNGDIKAPEFPVLHPGENEVSFSGGIESLEITPNWWTL